MWEIITAVSLAGRITGTEGTLGYVLITDDTPCGHSLYLLEGGATWVGRVGGAARGMVGMMVAGDWTSSRYNLTVRG